MGRGIGSAVAASVLLAACTPPGTSTQAPATVWVTESAPTSAPTVWVTVTAEPSGPTPAVTPTHAAGAPSTGGPNDSQAQALLESMPVREAAPLDGYSRDAFGQKYSDDVDEPGGSGHNGCDARNDMLRRDLEDLVVKPRTRGCVALSGVLVDPYTGATISYVAGKRSPIDFEHVVALENAWRTGAQELAPAERQNLANDPLNLLMVGSAVNRGKGSSDIAGWRPPDRGAWCAYAARQLAVKQRYHLWLTPPERAAMGRILGTCPEQRLPTLDEVRAPTPAGP